MRSGKWRGVTLALGLACGLWLAAGDRGQARAGDVHTIPRLVPAVDMNTGGPYYAPPIPYGHYAGKDICGHVGRRVGGLFHGLLGKVCGACGGKGCGLCGGLGDGSGGHGGLFGGHGLGLGHGHGGAGACGGHGDGHFGGGSACGGHGLGLGLGLGHGSGHGGKGCGHASTVFCASGQGTPTPQAGPVTVIASDPCGDPGCRLLGRHKHKGCGLCGGKGCGGCAVADPCKACGGKGCGLCAKLCNLCGGLGCSACAKAKGLLAHLLGHDKIDWFVGPGGPVPLTPGYTPYVNVTRSPRDFLAFPPFVP